VPRDDAKNRQQLRIIAANTKLLGKRVRLLNYKIAHFNPPSLMKNMTDRP